MNEEDLLRRARAAYYRSGAVDAPPGGGRVATLEGKVYVIMDGGPGEVPRAVYRLQNSGQLRRMKRPPKAIQRGEV